MNDEPIVMSDKPIERDIYKERYEYIAHQISREDSLINNRLTWTLTLNGFLFAALGIIGSANNSAKEIVKFLNWALPLTGIAVSFSGFCGVLAAHIQIHYLTKAWKELGDNRWVRPFGDKKISFWLGTIPCFLPSVILIYTWFHFSRV